MVLMLIRRELPGDVAAIRAVTKAAFAKPDHPEPVEAELVGWLRADPGWIPKLSLVAVDAGEVVGHVVCTRGALGDQPAVGLGPISVAPGRQGRGCGTGLMHAVLGGADAMDVPVVLLLGSPAFYSRFGFVAASTLGIQAPDPAWGDYFQARTLTAYHSAIRGTFSYAKPFSEL
jgi:putative acetyltransferase